VGVTVTIVDYDASWPERYELESAAIADVLGPVALRIDHVGSTSVPGLGAKPIVDIQVSVAALQPMAPYVEPLRAIGYEYFEWLNEDGIDDYPYFAKPPEPPRAFHIHVAESGSHHERRHLAFRDWLRAHPEDAAAYERTKRELATREWETTDHYANAKTAFIATITARALAEPAD
jgi:GrpB-like predicted nucleotidyltransferase (UPF0157 family)